ncbi:MAG: prenyltransferase/squalene oxidase repeat-containing protein [Gemmataceae bacterium]
MWTRRSFLIGGAALASVPVAYELLVGQERGAKITSPVTPAADKAIAQGLEYLTSQQHGNGSFGVGRYRGNLAITALGGLALIAGGHLPGRGKYGHVIKRALEFVLSQESSDPPGFLTNAAASHGPMYGHGFATLFLAELQGMIHDQPLRKSTRECLERSVRVILRSQNRTGGWRYRPDAVDADISVTICQIMALRSAKNAGILVPKEVADRCIAYVKRCQSARGSFRYMVEAEGDGIGFARTAAGLVALNAAGVYKGPEIDRGLRFLMDCKPGDPRLRHDMHYFYGHYYAAQAMWTAGGEYWQTWYPAIRDDLLNGPRHRPDGSWFDHLCTHYGTAMACIILQIPNNYLPILQK